MIITDVSYWLWLSILLLSNYFLLSEYALVLNNNNNFINIPLEILVISHKTTINTTYIQINIWYLIDNHVTPKFLTFCINDKLKPKFRNVPPFHLKLGWLTKMGHLISQPLLAYTSNPSENHHESHYPSHQRIFKRTKRLKEKNPRGRDGPHRLKNLIVGGFQD